MKGNLTRDQILILAGGVVLIALTGGLGWLGLSGLTEELQHAEELAQRKSGGDLATILSRPGGVSAGRKDIAELQKLIQELSKMEEASIGPWRRGWEEASGVGMDWSKDPGKWKDKLVKDNDEVLRRCARSKDLSTVTLGENFYLGMEEFKQKSPSNEQVPALARQLSVAKKLVDLLILAKKIPEGYTTPCVLSGLEVPWSREGPNPEVGKSNKGPDDKNVEYLRESYRLRLNCSPEVLYQYVRLLNQDGWLFIITNLALVNERETFPKRGEIAKLFQSEPTATNLPPNQETPRASESAPGKPKLLLVLSGKERVEVNLEVDYVGWKNPPTAAKIPEAKK